MVAAAERPEDMTLIPRTAYIRRLLEERNLSKSGLQRALTDRLLEAVAVDPDEDLYADDDKWAWLHDTRDEIAVIDEMRHRRDQETVFNKRREDFGEGGAHDARAHDAYLEKVEEVIFNLTNGESQEETRAFIQRYRMENAESISKNNARRAEERRAQEASIAEDSRLQDERRRSHRAEDAAKRRDDERAIVETNEVLLGVRDKADMSGPTAGRPRLVAGASAMAGGAGELGTPRGSGAHLTALLRQEPVQPKKLTSGVKRMFTDVQRQAATDCIQVGNHERGWSELMNSLFLTPATAAAAADVAAAAEAATIAATATADGAQ